jgi:hypothetical protein
MCGVSGTYSDTGPGPGAAVLILLGIIVHDPRAIVARLLRGNGLGDDGDLHDFTPVLVE